MDLTLWLLRVCGLLPLYLPVCSICKHTGGMASLWCLHLQLLE